MERSEEITELLQALSKAQGEIGTLTKGETAEVAMRGAGKYSYSYADLAAVREAIRDAMAANGFSIVQSPTVLGEPGVQQPILEVLVETFLFHKSGQWLKNSIRMPVSRNDPQGIGSAITYARRYALLALLGLAAEDDDGQAARSEDPKEPERVYKDSGYYNTMLSRDAKLNTKSAIETEATVLERLDLSPKEVTACNNWLRAKWKILDTVEKRKATEETEGKENGIGDDGRSRPEDMDKENRAGSAAEGGGSPAESSTG